MLLLLINDNKVDLSVGVTELAINYNRFQNSDPFSKADSQVCFNHTNYITGLEILCKNMQR